MSQSIRTFSASMSAIAEQAAADAALVAYLEDVLKAEGKTPPTDLVVAILEISGRTTGTFRECAGNLLAVALRGEPMPWESVG